MTDRTTAPHRGPPRTCSSRLIRLSLFRSLRFSCSCRCRGTTCGRAGPVERNQPMRHNKRRSVTEKRGAAGGESARERPVARGDEGAVVPLAVCLRSVFHQRRNDRILLVTFSNGTLERSAVDMGNITRPHDPNENLEEIKRKMKLCRQCFRQLVLSTRRRHTAASAGWRTWPPSLG